MYVHVYSCMPIIASCNYQLQAYTDRHVRRVRRRTSPGNVTMALRKFSYQEISVPECMNISFQTETVSCESNVKFTEYLVKSAGTFYMRVPLFKNKSV